MSDSSERDVEIFAAALALPPAERPGFLETACAGDPDLRRRIEVLLQAEAAAGGFMATAPLELAAGTHPPEFAPRDRLERRGTQIDRYHLLQKLGEGGCGVVWLAEQTEPVRRRVALKILKPGMDTREVLARFEAERQALARMDHPNIAKVFDAGTTDAGRPYFVMELVQGVKITDYCDQHNLATDQRLKVFSDVCHAVQHAHQKGVIHRDLKPSNILVTQLDNAPVPKVIDFGIAKATQGRLTDQTLFTAFEQFIGTPAYMSPEQADLSGADIDTRSDVYSLGVLLYELLTGRPPFDPKTLLQAGLDEIRRIIREVDPPKPSANVATLTDADRAEVARHHSTDPARLPLQLRGDLDWIVMKALEKNRARRYDTVNALAADIERHLRDEPVSAGPPSAYYRLAKLVRRHRLAFAAAAAVALALVAGTIVSTWQAVRAKRAEHRAATERGRAEDLLSFMVGDLHAMLSKVGRLDVLASVGDKALAYFATRAEGDLDDVARLRHAKALRQIGEVRMVEARSAEALAAFTDAHRRMAALAQRHPREGEFLFERAVAESWIGMTHRKVNARAEATEWLQRANQTAAAAVALDPSRLDWQSELSSGRHNLAILRKESGDLDGAHADFLTALPLRERLSAADPASSFLRDRVAEVHSQLSEIADRQGAYAEALQRYTTKAGLLEEIARMEPKNPTWRHRLADTRIMQSDLLVAMGQLQPAAGRLQEAWQLLNELTAYEPANRDWQVSLLVTRLREATLAQKQGDLARAVRLVEEVRPRFEELTTGPAVNRRFAIRLMTAWRLEAQLRAAAGRGDALAAALSAVNLGAKWFADPRAYDADLGACAQSYVVAGELVARAGDGAAARRHWEQALALLTPHLQPDTRDRRLLDPAARAAMLLGRTDEARARIAQLDRLGYIPLDPWPEPARTPEPQPPTR